MQEALAFCMAGYVVRHSMSAHAVGIRIGLKSLDFFEPLHHIFFIIINFSITS